MRFQCRCGRSMWNGQTPNDIEFWVYSDKRMCDEILDNDTIDTVKLASMYNYNVWRCPDCRRLYVFEKGNTKVLNCYKLEDE